MIDNATDTDACASKNEILPKVVPNRKLLYYCKKDGQFYFVWIPSEKIWCDIMSPSGKLIPSANFQTTFKPLCFFVDLSEGWLWNY